jgi:oligopeptide transport system substrate-binding protein
VKEGKLPVDQLGIETPDDKTIVVHLEGPLPYFKDLVSSHFFLPVHPASTPENPICNGPFKLEEWKKNNELTGIKNPEYWDVNHIILEKFSFIHLDDHTALQLYDADQVDWAGSPLGLIPQDAILTLKKKQHLLTVPSAGIYWFRINTTKAPLSNPKIRLALAYALDRAALVKNVVQGNQEAALSIVPPSMGLKTENYFTDADTTKAWELFESGLAELNMTIEDFPKITILYNTAAERNQKIVQAVQQQWKKIFGDKIQLQGNESKAVFQQLGQLNYDIALGSWFADIDDPSNFLDIFSKKTNAGNNTGWENAHYSEIIQQSLLAKNPEQRNEQLLKAQSLLMQEMPVIPLFFGAFNYVKKRPVSNVRLSSMGHLDLKHAFIDIGDVEQLEVMD